MSTNTNEPILPASGYGKTTMSVPNIEQLTEAEQNLCDDLEAKMTMMFVKGMEFAMGLVHEEARFHKRSNNQRFCEVIENAAYEIEKRLDTPFNGTEPGVFYQRGPNSPPGWYFYDDYSMPNGPYKTYDRANQAFTAYKEKP